MTRCVPRSSSNPRATDLPLAPEEARDHVGQWRRAPSGWTPEPGPGHDSIMAELLTRDEVRGSSVIDVVLATMCVDHGLEIVRADSDVACVEEIEWIDPVAAGRSG